MKLLWCCLVTALVSAVSAAVDVEKTVRQVQNILQANSGLPRLSREEIIQLLNDIKAEDAKSKSSSTDDSKEVKTTSQPYKIEDNEINPINQLPDIKENIVSYERDVPAFISSKGTTTKPPSTTKKNEPSVVVVLPYTPRDGSSLQELYTRPPRVEVVPVSQVTTPSPLLETLEKLHKSLDNINKPGNSKEKLKDDFPAELQAFLNAHGLKGKSGQDHFLLPLEGFKPLPPAKVVDGTVQLPENILLTYDLISADSEHKPIVHDQIPPANFLYEPLRPEYPFELEASPSESQKTVLPLDLPVRKTKSTETKHNYEPIDYDAVKVIPLKQGLSPLDDVKAALESEQNKRQAENTTTESPKEEVSPEPSTSESNTKSDDTSAGDSAASDTGASIADLEESFGGAAPEEPGDSELPPPRKNGFYWMLDWNSFLEVGDGDTKVNIRFEPKLGDPQMFIPVNVP